MVIYGNQTGLKFGKDVFEPMIAEIQLAVVVSVSNAPPIRPVVL